MRWGTRKREIALGVELSKLVCSLTTWLSAAASQTIAQRNIYATTSRYCHYASARWDPQLLAADLIVGATTARRPIGNSVLSHSSNSVPGFEFGKDQREISSRRRFYHSHSRRTFRLILSLGWDSCFRFPFESVWRKARLLERTYRIVMY